MTSQETSINLAPRNDDTTRQKLYRISNDAYTKITEKDRNSVSRMKDLGDMYDGQSKQVLVLLKDESKPRSEVEDFIKKSYNNTLQEKRKFEELADDDSSLDNNNAYVEEERYKQVTPSHLFVPCRN